MSSKHVLQTGPLPIAKKVATGSNEPYSADIPRSAIMEIPQDTLIDAIRLLAKNLDEDKPAVVGDTPSIASEPAAPDAQPDAAREARAGSDRGNEDGAASDAPAPRAAGDRIEEEERQLLTQLQKADEQSTSIASERTSVPTSYLASLLEWRKRDKSDKASEPTAEATSAAPTAVTHISEQSLVSAESPLFGENSSFSALRNNSLLSLDIISMQILDFFSNTHYSDIIAVVSTQNHSDASTAYASLLALLDHTKRIYAPEGVFILASPSAPWANTKEKRLIIQHANMATFMAALFGSLEIGFFHLDKYFLQVFCGDNKLLKPQCNLYLELKTQAYISAMAQCRDQQQALDELFPSDLESKLRSFSSDERDFPAGAAEFVQKCQNRREALLSTNPSEDLSEKYDWLSFLKDMTDYMAKYHHVSARSFRVKAAKATATPNIADTLGAISRNKKSKSSDMVPTDSSSLVDAPPAQSFAPAKPQTSYLRRPWTRDEEDALMAGLERVKGPYWAQILELYGPGGKESEVLKDRTQIQLKDKARNLKLFFLKTGSPLPPVLQFVTGDIRTRLGGSGGSGRRHAANKEHNHAASVSPMPSVDDVDLSAIHEHLKQVAAEEQAAESSTNIHRSQDNAFETEANLEALLSSVGAYVEAHSSGAPHDNNASSNAGGTALNIDPSIAPELQGDSNIAPELQHDSIADHDISRIAAELQQHVQQHDPSIAPELQQTDISNIAPELQEDNSQIAPKLHGQAH